MTKTNKKYSEKQARIENVNSWLVKFKNEFPGIAYKLKGTDISVLNGMTLDQVKFCLSMTCAGFAAGSETSRKYWSPRYHAMRQAAERKTGNADISFGALKLVKD